MCCFCTGTLRSTFDSPNRFSLMLWIDKRGFRYIANRTNLKSTRNKNYAFGCTSLNYNGIHQKWLLFRCLKDIYTLLNWVVVCGIQMTVIFHLDEQPIFLCVFLFYYRIRRIFERFLHNDHTSLSSRDMTSIWIYCIIFFMDTF